MEGPLKIRSTLPQERHDDLECLLESGEDMVLGQSEGVPLRLGTPRAQTEHEAATADLVDGLDGLGGDPGVPVQR